MNKEIVRHSGTRDFFSPFDLSLRDFWNHSPLLRGGFFPSTDFEYQWNPLVDIVEEENQFKAEVDLPGFSPKDIRVEVEDNALAISGKKESSKEEKLSPQRAYDRVFLPEDDTSPKCESGES